METGTNPFAKQILHGFVLVTMRGLNSYKMSMMTHWQQLIFLRYKIRKKYVIEVSFFYSDRNLMFILCIVRQIQKNMLQFSYSTKESDLQKVEQYGENLGIF